MSIPHTAGVVQISLDQLHESKTNAVPSIIIKVVMMACFVHILRNALTRG